jgi:hypothetical protein
MIKGYKQERALNINIDYTEYALGALRLRFNDAVTCGIRTNQ